MGSAVRRAVVTAIAIATMVACSDGDDGELTLDGDDTPATTVPDPPGDDGVQPDDDADGTDVDDGADDATDEPPPEDEEVAFPPFPDVEPDPDSEVSVEDQEFFLELHARVYEATQRAAADPDYDLDQLDELLAGDALDEMVATVERFRSDGVVSLAPDTEVVHASVVASPGGPAVVTECRRIGPRTALYDIGSDEPVELGTAREVFIETRYDPLLVDDEPGIYAVEFLSSVAEGGCDE